MMEFDAEVTEERSTVPKATRMAEAELEAEVTASMLVVCDCFQMGRRAGLQELLVETPMQP